MSPTKILFICKQRELPSVMCDDQTYSAGKKTSGLYNSVKFVIDMLTDCGIECKMVEVIDNNCIDREVTTYKPTHVIIEALWVVPDKFAELTRLHPLVKWYVRLHSDVPFIANEGIAFDWLAQYVKYPNVYVAANSPRIAKDLECLHSKQVVYLPNFYPIEKIVEKPSTCFLSKFSWNHVLPSELNIGCFGAVRPLKNQLIQAVAAIRLADNHGVKLKFHINGSRIEGKGDPVLKNIRKLFEHSKHELVEHDWLEHGEFVELLKKMDATLQVSFTETYNIVAADSIAALCPVVTSTEISFVDSKFHAVPTSTSDIMEKLEMALKSNREYVTAKNWRGLQVDAMAACRSWLNVFRY